MNMKKLSKELEEEAKAFDERIKERVKQGHIPDLRRATFCEWFYNNPWRHPIFVDWTFGEYFRFALKIIGRKKKEILEVGSGPGHMALELARYGHNVDGIEISKEAIKVAERMKEENPFKSNMGNLNYYRCDFLDLNPRKKYDFVCFFLVLHHFKDLNSVMAKVKSLLKKNGKIIAIEPATDFFSKENAFFVATIRIILSFFKGWYENLKIPERELEFLKYFKEVLKEFKETKDKNEKKQSPHDNLSKGTEMLEILRKNFKEIKFKYGYSFLPRVVGGVRASREEENIKLANFLRIIDNFGVKNNILSPTSFYFAGVKKEDL